MWPLPQILPASHDEPIPAGGPGQAAQYEALRVLARDQYPILAGGGVEQVCLGDPVGLATGAAQQSSTGAPSSGTGNCLLGRPKATSCASGVKTTGTPAKSEPRRLASAAVYRPEGTTWRFIGRRDVRLSLGSRLQIRPLSGGSLKRAPDQGFRARCAGWI
jgi:hypothetical protein